MVAPNGPNKLLVTLPEAAQMLSISERVIWNLGMRGEIPRVRIGRSVRFRVADIESWALRQLQGQAR